MKLSKRKIALLGFLILLIGFFIISLMKNRQLIGLLTLPSLPYEPTLIPKDTAELMEYDGYIENDLVYIYVQGGPNWELFDRKLSPFTWMPQSGKFLKVYPYQSQILNHSVLGAVPTLTAEQAEHEVQVSAEMLYRTISFFKHRNKTVYVLCISHGSQIGLELLRNYPNEADGIALTMIRLDMDIEAIEITEKGKIPHYEAGEKLTSRELLPSFLRFPRLKNRVENMSMMMKVSRNRYTDLLQNKDLSNVVYVYGKRDAKVGAPAMHELDFLGNKGVKILELDCGHDDLGNTGYLEQINELLIYE